MGELKLDKEQNLDKKNQLSKLHDYIGSIIDKNAKQVAIDKERMGLLSSEKDSFVINAFWSYFKRKYEIGDIEKYYSDKDQMMKEIFQTCLMPFNVESDAKYSRFDSKKDKFVNYMNKFKFWLMDCIQRINLSKIATIVLIIMLVISFYCFKNNNIWLSNLFMGISSGIITAIIIATINKRIKRIVNGFEIHERYIKDEVASYLKMQNEKISKLKSSIHNEQDFLMNVNDISRLLSQHCKSMGYFNRIRNREFYSDIDKVNEEMYKAISVYTKQLFFGRDEALIKLEKDTLILLVFDLEIATIEYKKNVDVYLRTRRRQVDVIRDKGI